MSGLTSEASADPNLLVGFDTGDDAAIYRLDDGVALVLTVDFFAPVVDDPFQYGAIAAANALSDVYAVGGRPMLALNIAAFPRSLPIDIAPEILRGGAEKCKEAGVIIVGGHTVDDSEPKYGLAVIGTVTPGAQVQNSTAQSGNALVLTKPVGTGIISTACKAGDVDVDVLDGCIESMLQLNKDASEAMLEAGASAATDISGFGLVGHLMTMMRASDTTGIVSRSQVPILQGAEKLLGEGVVSGGTNRNMESCEGIVSWGESLGLEDRLMLCDAQTSGGLLISLPMHKSDSLIESLSARGVSGSVVGEVTDFDGTPVRVVS